jgi:iron complex transport system substrate-binding protein
MIKTLFMKTTIIHVILLSIILGTAFLFFGCSSKKKAVSGRSKSWLISKSESSVTVRDNGGHEVTVTGPVKKIMVSGMGVFPSVRALGAEHMVIGTQGIDAENDKDLFPVMMTKPVLAKGEPGASLDYEYIIGQQPDLFVVLGVLWQEVHDNLSKAGIPVVQLDFIETKDVLILGTLLGKEQEAGEYVTWIDQQLKNISDKVSSLNNSDRPEVFLYYGGAYGMSPAPPYGTYGRGNDLGNKLISMAGGKSVTADLKGEWITVDPEWIIMANPDVIVREYYSMQHQGIPYLGNHVTGSEDALVYLKEIQSKTAFKSTKAADKDTIYLVYGHLISEYWFLGVQYLAKSIHPELFTDLDPDAVYQEYITRYMRSDYKVSQGLFTATLQGKDHE